MQQLQIDASLQNGRYRIISVLGQGGFGITYLAIQSGLERKVAIKEFFMKEFCERDEATSHVTLGTESSRETVNRFREKFLKEARNIARLNHPHIIRIFDVFEENGTAYYVMEYCENGSLADKVKREGALSETVATHYILQVADALDYIHRQKMNHLDVKPANILLNENDEAVLIDFGLSKQYDAVTGSQTSTTPVGISNGYAPMEQYRPGGVSEFSPQTDIYSLGATFFMLLTGITPPSASDINEDGVPVDELKAKNVKRKTFFVICKAMKGRKKDRLQDITSFIEYLTDSPSELSNTDYKPNVQNEVTISIDDTKKEKCKRLNETSQIISQRGKIRKKYISKVLFCVFVIFAIITVLIFINYDSKHTLSPSQEKEETSVTDSISLLMKEQSIEKKSRNIVSYAVAGQYLEAKIGENTYTVYDIFIGKIEIIDTYDYNGDGNDEVIFSAVSGNTASIIYYLEYLGDGRFSDPQEIDMTYKKVTVNEEHSDKGRIHTIVIESPQANGPSKTIVYAYKNGAMQKVSASSKGMLKSVKELTSDMFPVDSDYGDTKSLIYDLDNDGREDIVWGSYWPRWRLMFLHVKFGNGKSFEGHTGYFRIGILSSKTNGVNDLVVDESTIIKWNGDNYIE